MKSQSLSSLVSALAASGASRKDLERRLAQMGLGIVAALRDAGMSLEQAQQDLFNLDTYNAVRKHRLSAHLVEFLQWGMELEDVTELAPEALDESYEQMTALARRVLTESLPKVRRAQSGQVNRG